jgi:hypothetical protein
MNRLLPLYLLLAASPLEAQMNRDAMLADWTRSRSNVLAYLDAMPQEHLGFKPTEGVRSFAEQIEHIALDNLILVGVGVKGLTEPPKLAEPTVYLKDKAALRSFVDRSYEFVIDAIREAPAEAFTQKASVFGVEMVRYRFSDTALEHSAWTLGQVVPYLRLKGVTPPDYRSF